MLTVLARLLGRSEEPSHGRVVPLPMVEPPASATLDAFLDAAPDGIVMVDESGLIVAANEQLYRMLGYAPNSLEGQPVEQLVPDRHHAAHVGKREGYQRMPHTRRMGSKLALTARRADETALPVDIALGSVVLADRRMTLAFVRDASEQQALWDELAAAKASLEAELEERRQYRALTELLQTLRSREEIRSVLSLHMERLFPETNGSLALLDASHDTVDALVCWGCDPLPEQFPLDACVALRLGRVHETDASREVACTHRACEGQHSLCVPLMADGETLGVLHLQADPRARSGHGPSGGLTADERRRASDIAERLALPLANIVLRDRLLNQSVRDPLTGVYNRRQMDESIGREISRAARLAYGVSVALVDIDHFKRFNDTLGHDAGDTLLRAFAQFLASHLRLDDAVFRYGGEEFVLVLPGAAGQAAAERLQALRAEWRQQAAAYGREVTFSAGVGEFPSHGTTSHEVLRAADGALYQAKALGRDRVIVAGYGAVAPL